MLLRGLLPVLLRGLLPVPLRRLLAVLLRGLRLGRLGILTGLAVLLTGLRLAVRLTLGLALLLRWLALLLGRLRRTLPVGRLGWSLRGAGLLHRPAVLLGAVLILGRLPLLTGCVPRRLSGLRSEAGSGSHCGAVEGVLLRYIRLGSRPPDAL